MFLFNFRPGSVIKSGQFNKPKDIKPVYIHIPLKLPEGQTDEFSHLQSEPIAPELKTTQLTDSLDSSSPGSPQKDDIHFIFLTPPSDDEILDEKVCGARIAKVTFCNLYAL